MNNDPRGIMIQQGNTMRINNGFVEDVSCFNNARGQILVSYAVRERNNITSIQDIQLNINRGTVILNSFGQRMCLCCIQAGSWVNATFSARMTRSIPPQANAFLVTVPVSYTHLVAASKTYQGSNYTDRQPLEYYEKGAAKLGKMIHPETAALLHFLLKMLAEEGEEKTFRYIRRKILKK